MCVLVFNSGRAFCQHSRCIAQFLVLYDSVCFSYGRVVCVFWSLAQAEHFVSTRGVLHIS